MLPNLPKCSGSFGPSERGRWPRILLLRVIPYIQLVLQNLITALMEACKIWHWGSYHRSTLSPSSTEPAVLDGRFSISSQWGGCLFWRDFTNSSRYIARQPFHGAWWIYWSNTVDSWDSSLREHAGASSRRQSSRGKILSSALRSTWETCPCLSDKLH